MNQIKRFAALTVALIFLALPQAASAQNYEMLKSQDSALAQPELYQLDSKALAELLAINSDCARCDANISGKWTYTLLKSNIPYLTRTVRINQFGKSFKAVNPSHTLVGSLRGQWLNLTLVVTGEESEGYVMKVDGSIDGNRITGVFLDSEGEVGSFVAFRR